MQVGSPDYFTQAYPVIISALYVVTTQLTASVRTCMFLTNLVTDIYLPLSSLLISFSCITTGDALYYKIILLKLNVIKLASRYNFGE